MISPFPNVVVLQSSQSSKIRAAQHWGRGGHVWVRRENVRHFEKIQEKRFLFQRFMTMIVASLGEMSVKKKESFSPPHLHSFLKLLCRVPRNH